MEKNTMFLDSQVDKVVDTVGAGDGFAVGILSGLLEGLSIESYSKRKCNRCITGYAPK